MRFLLTFAVNALALWIVSLIVPAIKFTSTSGLIIASILISLINSYVKPVLKMITFPITIITLGLWLIFLNLFLFWFVDWIVPGFEMHGFWGSLLGIIIYSILVAIMESLVGLRDEDTDKKLSG